MRNTKKGLMLLPLFLIIAGLCMAGCGKQNQEAAMGNGKGMQLQKAAPVGEPTKKPDIPAEAQNIPKPNL